MEQPGMKQVIQQCPKKEVNNGRGHLAIMQGIKQTNKSVIRPFPTCTFLSETFTKSVLQSKPGKLGPVKLCFGIWTHSVFGWQAQQWLCLNFLVFQTEVIIIEGQWKLLCRVVWAQSTKQILTTLLLFLIIAESLAILLKANRTQTTVITIL